VSVFVVEVAISNAEVMHLIKVDEIETISHFDPSLNINDMLLPSFKVCGKAEPVKVRIVPP
jgi:hypothetical protein